MNDKERKQREYDLVLGGNNPPPTDGLVLGGIEGVKQRLENEDVEVRIAALKNAIAFGDEGIDVVISVLEDRSKLVQNQAYLILKKCSSLKAKKALKNYNHWSLFGCLKKLNYYKDNNHWREHFSVDCMVLSSDEKTLLTGSTNSIKMWDIKTGTLIYNKKFLSESITCLAISSNSKLLANGSSEQTITLWDIKAKKITKKQVLPVKQSGEIIFLGFSADGNNLFSIRPFRTIQIWDCKSKVNKSYQGDIGDIKACTMSLDRHIFVSGKHLINIVDLITGETQYSLQSTREISVVAISPDKNMLATTDEHRPSNSSIKIWNLATGNIERTLYDNSHYIKSLVFSPDGNTLISGSQDGKIKIWDLKTGNPIITLEGHISTVTCLIVTHDGQKIISGSLDYITSGNLDSSIKIWGIE